MLQAASPTADRDIVALDLAASRSSRWSKLLTYAVVVELAVLYAPTVVWLFERWTMSVWQHAHGLLIPPVVGYFVYQELRPLSGLPRNASPWGFAFLVPALAVTALD